MRTPYKGKNRYRTFLKAGKTITKKISKLDGVVGVLGTGSIGRRFGDEYSDLDLLVYAQNNCIKSLDKLISIGWISYKEMEFDIVVLSYQKALRAKSPSRFWTQLRRWDHQNSQILFDVDDRTRNLLQKKLVYPDWEQKKLLRKYHNEVHEYLVFFPELWAKRGQLYNVVDSLIRAVQSIVLWIYAKNKAFEPYVPKWLFYHLENQSLPEAEYLSTLTEVFTKPIRTLTEAMQIRRKLLHLCDRIGIKYEIYSFSEAHQRTKKNWEGLSEESKKMLSW
ncbi:MAG: hypothetical protein AMJ90_06345 [candidate division Zixibacteria bacterium SM23_73_2]|nr:MAG: hypothetical protein AMJ90_06345 [candidate division Zixibacteria bacterium SM23_73_2]